MISISPKDFRDMPAEYTWQHSLSFSVIPDIKFTEFGFPQSWVSECQDWSIYFLKIATAVSQSNFYFFMKPPNNRV